MNITRQIWPNHQLERIEQVRNRPGTKYLAQIGIQAAYVIELLNAKRRNRLPAPNDGCPNNGSQDDENGGASLPVGDAAVQQERAGKRRAYEMQIERGEDQPPAGHP